MPQYLTVAEHANIYGAFENEQRYFLKQGLWISIENFYCPLAVCVKSGSQRTKRGVTQLFTMEKRKGTCPKEKLHFIFKQPRDLHSWKSRSQCEYSNWANCNVSSERKCWSQAETEECRSLAHWLETAFRQSSIQRWIEIADHPIWL